MWDWLLSLDKGKGGLLQYFPRIQMEFDCEFAQIAASRLPQPVSDGVLGMVQPQLFEAATPLVSLLLLLKGALGGAKLTIRASRAYPGVPRSAR
ncbi:unnamed protein product [Prorocentrum cordatum]|uniref:Uncharacterized protein n=1 Tax=Prorocentrum cordatum TaxID=2364126 RepID=A0ABN9QV42_9DINO|nr:unnamed protein product [Polarella glacialis]